MSWQLKVRRFASRREPFASSKLRIGLITLSTDLLTEAELKRILNDSDVLISATRIPTHNPLTIENLRRHMEDLDKAAALFEPGCPMDVFMYACTSGAAAGEADEVAARVRHVAPTAQVTDPMRAGLRSFQALGIRRLAVLTPYPDEVNGLVLKHISSHGYEIVSAATFDIKNDFEIGDVAVDSITDGIADVNNVDAEAVFVPCTGLRVSVAIERAEQLIGKPVIAAHQAMLWDSLRLGGYRKKIHGFGRLLSL